MAQRAYFSIGEVLQALQPQFPDLTISRIRTLEAQGLIEPARTPSGYRKFNSDDINQLRVILTESSLASIMSPPVMATSAMGHPAAFATSSSSSGSTDATQFESSTVNDAFGLTDEITVDYLDGSGSDNEFTIDELIERSGVDQELIKELRDHGLIVPKNRAGLEMYSASAVKICRIANGFAKYGLAPRHYRSIKTGADREAGLLEQVANPYLRQRSQTSRATLQSAVGELVGLFVNLHKELLQQSLGELVEN